MGKAILVKCNFCQKEFLASPSRIARGAAKHCSRKCADQNRPPIKSKKIAIKCIVCDLEFLIKPSRIDTAEFCSKKCRGIKQTLDETELRNCLTCDIEFRASKFEIERGYDKFCSDKCRLLKPKTGTYKPCLICKKDFYVEPFRENFSKYCSNECRHLGLITSINKSCENCHRNFLVQPSQIERGIGKFCSNECRYKGKFTGKYILCPNCGSEFYATKGKLAKNKNSFCSQKCSAEYRVGENSPSWRGGVTSESKKIRYSQEYKNWRTSVFGRDNYTCCHCDARSGIGSPVHLQAHHIKEFVNYPELRFDIDNGETLCIECHRETDNWGCKSKKPKNSPKT